MSETHEDATKPNAISPGYGDAQGHAGRGSAGKNSGAHKTNERDERGYPVGHPSFAGGSSPEHGLDELS